MKDRFGREIDYIRISVTDRCNLRCRYCMPRWGIEQVSHDQILRFDEILRLAKILCEKGIKNVKITGGEPLVRKGIVDLIREIKCLDGIETVTLTTNGVLLGEHLPELAAAGIDGINVSLDTLDREKYREITGSDSFDKVMESIKMCEAYPEIKLKLNVVTLDEYNKDEIEDFAGLAADGKIDVRFIEMMPMGLGRTMKGYGQDYILERLTAEYGEAAQVPGTQPVDKQGVPGALSMGTPGEEPGAQGAQSMGTLNSGNGPAVYYQFEGLKGRIGFISPLSHMFCDRCNRIRLTAEGVLKPCLQFAGGTDLREPLRRGVDDESLGKLVEEGIYMKPEHHEFCQGDIADEEKRLMSEIGG